MMLTNYKTISSSNRMAASTTRAETTALTTAKAISAIQKHISSFIFKTWNVKNTKQTFIQRCQELGSRHTIQYSNHFDFNHLKYVYVIASQKPTTVVK